MVSFRINFKSILIAFWGTIVFPIIGTFLIGWVMVTLYKGWNYELWLVKENGLEIIGIIIISMSFPAIFLFLEYFFYNKSMSLNINRSDGYIEFITKNSKYTSNLKDIKYCVLFRETKGWHYIPASNYSFVLIEFYDGTRKIVTCLLDWDLRHLLEGIGYKEKRAFFPAVLIFKNRDIKKEYWDQGYDKKNN